ncbi:MAG: hypothetical protein KJ062_05000, partial [Thermoanaerobaculia bacterium]|nr:hypothetical protein [Thermoanaerobaculia bacterium]
MPQKPSPEDLRDLLVPRTEPCISLFLPLPRHGPDLATAPLRFRALVREAEGLLKERYDARRVKGLLAPLAGLAEAVDVFGAGPEGLAVFRADGLFETFRLWPPPPERVVVADSFHVKPLLRCLQARHRYFVLALGTRRVALYEGTGPGLGPRAVPGLPAPLESPGQGPAGRGSAPRGGSRPAGAGAGKAPSERDGARREDLLRYFRAVDAAVRDVLASGEPLLVAGAASLLPLFREVCGHRGLHPEGVEGAVDDVGADELHARALPSARRALEARDAALVEEFRRQLDRGLAADVLTRVAEAAVGGRVSRLLVADGKPLFGRVDRSTGEVTLHAGQSGPQADDGLDDLAAIVLARGGAGRVLDPS